LIPILILAAFLCAYSGFWIPGASAPQHDGWPKRLTYAAGIVPRGMNPLLDRAGWNEVSSVVLSRLVRPDHKGGIEDDLAESWTVSPDGRVYEFRLRRGVTWHDGAPFTADDVLFTWEKLFDPATETSLDLNQASLAKFQKKDAHTFVFELKAPDSGFLAALTEIAILPAHRLRDADINSDAFDRAMIGTRPYKLASATENRDFLLARHDNYHLGRPAFDELLIRVIADDDARAHAVAEGQADLAHVKPPHVEMLRAKGRSILRMRTGAWRAMPLNLRRPALQDVRVRQAIDLAIDREAIVREALQGYGQAAYSPIPPASWAFSAAMNEERRDSRMAEQLLDRAGWDAFILTHDSQNRIFRRKGQDLLKLKIIVWKDEFFRRTAAELMRKQLNKVGIQMELHLVDGTTYNRLAENMGTEYDGYIGGWGGLLDPGDNLYKKYHSRGSQNRTGYSNPKVDKLLEEARRTTDRKKAIPLYEKVVALVTRDAVFLPLAYPDYLFAARAELTGIEDYTLDSWYEFTKYAAEWKPK
jgi:peptide/nickel transport system substrate-binding protein